MSSFWIYIGLLMLALNAAWWVVALRLTKGKPWHMLVSVFMAGQLAAHLAAMAGVDLCPIPKAVIVPIIIWHRMGLIFALAILLVIGIVRARAWMVRRNHPVPTPASAHSQTRREFIGTCAAVAPALFTIGLTGVGLAQLRHFRVRRFTLSVPALPCGLDGITIAHVSDMHVGTLTRGRVLREMVNTTNALRADLVLLTGDLIHYHLTDLSEALATVKAMEGRYGLWMIEGNHDLFDDGAEFARRVKAKGVPLLLDESAVANVRGYPVQFFGLRWMGQAKWGDQELGDQELDRITAMQMRGLMKHRQPDAFPILLAHHPHAFDAAVKADLPLTLAGHTHGGQMMLNRQYGTGPVLFRYWSGLYTRGRSQMIVSNGVGNMFPVRINAPAEIVHITLRCA